MVDIVMNELLLWMMNGNLHGCLIRIFLKVYSKETKSNLWQLGSKLRRNSGRNFGFGRNFRNFGPGVTEILFLQFAFLRCSSKCVIFKGLFYTTPHCEPCLGLSERAYQSFFRLRDSWSRRYQQSWTSIEAKTPEFLSEPRTSLEPERNRGQFRTFDRKEFLRN